MNNNPVNVFETKTDKPKRTFSISPEGNVTVIESITTTSKMSYREFVTFYRQHEQRLEEINDLMSEEHIGKLQEDVNYLNDQLKELSPIFHESEKLTQDHYKKLVAEGKISKIREQLNLARSDRNDKYLVELYNNLSEGEKDIIDHELTEAEKQEIVHTKLKIKRKSQR